MPGEIVKAVFTTWRDHFPPKVFFEEPSFWLAHSGMGIHSAINIQITKQIGGGAQWVELSY